jgi:hypothetical protein
MEVTYWLPVGEATRMVSTDTPPRLLHDVPAPEADTCLRSVITGEGAAPSLWRGFYLVDPIAQLNRLWRQLPEQMPQ